MSNLQTRSVSAKKTGYFPKDSHEKMQKVTLNLLEVLNIVDPFGNWKQQIEQVKSGKCNREDLKQIFSISFVNWKRKFN